MLGEFAGRSRLMDFLLRKAARFVDTGRADQVLPFVKAYAKFWHLMAQDQGQTMGAVPGKLKELREKGGAAAFIAKHGWRPAYLFLTHGLDELYRQNEDPINSLRDRIETEFVDVVSPGTAMPADETAFVNKLADLFKGLDRTTEEGTQKRQRLAMVFQSDVLKTIEETDPVLARFEDRVGFGALGAMLPLHYTKAGLKEFARFWKDAAAAWKTGRLWPKGWLFLGAYHHLLIPFPVHLTDLGWKAFFRFWGDERGMKESRLSPHEILIGVIHVPFQRHLWSGRYAKGASGTSNGSAMRFWFMTLGVTALYMGGLTIAVGSYLIGYGQMVEWGLRWVTAMGVSWELLTFFAIVTYPAFTQLAIGFTTYRLGLKKRVAEAGRTLWPWPRWKMTRLYNKVKDDIDPVTGKSYRTLLVEWADHYWREGFLVRTSGRRCVPDNSSNRGRTKLGTRLNSYFNSIVIEQAGLEAWERMLSTSQHITMADDTVQEFSWDQIVVKGSQDGRDTRLHYLTERKPDEWKNLIERLSGMYGSGEAQVLLRQLVRLRENVTPQCDLTHPEVAAISREVARWFNMRQYTNYRLLASLTYVQKAFHDYAQNYFFDEEYQVLRERLTGSRATGKRGSQKTTKVSVSRGATPFRVGLVLSLLLGIPLLIASGSVLVAVIGAALPVALLMTLWRRSDLKRASALGFKLGPYATDAEVYNAIKSGSVSAGLMTAAERDEFVQKYEYYRSKGEEKIQIMLSEVGYMLQTSLDPKEVHDGELVISKFSSSDSIAKDVLKPLEDLGEPIGEGSGIFAATTASGARRVPINDFAPKFERYVADLSVLLQSTKENLRDFMEARDPTEDMDWRLFGRLESLANFSLNDPTSHMHEQVIIQYTRFLELVARANGFEEELKATHDWKVLEILSPGAVQKNLSILRDDAKTATFMHANHMDYVQLPGIEGAVEPVKYGVWGRVMHQARGHLFQGIDSVQNVPYGYAPKMLRVLSEFSRNPALGIFLNGIQGSTEYFTSVASAAFLAESTWNLTGQRFKELMDVLGAYGKFFTQRSYMQRYEALTSDWVSEDIVTAFKLMNFGFVTKFDEYFQMGWRTPANLLLYINPSGFKYPSGQVEYQGIFGREFMRWLLNPSIPVHWKWGMLLNSWHYYKKPFVMGTILSFVFVTQILKWNLFAGLPDPAVWTAIGGVLAESINMSAYARAIERDGWIKGVAQTTWRILRHMPMFVVNLISNTRGIFLGGRGQAFFLQTSKAGDVVSSSVPVTVTIGGEELTYREYGQVSFDETMFDSRAFFWHITIGVVLSIGLIMLMPISLSLQTTWMLYLLTVVYWVFGPFTYTSGPELWTTRKKIVMLAYGLLVLAHPYLLSRLWPTMPIEYGLPVALGILALGLITPLGRQVLLKGLPAALKIKTVQIILLSLVSVLVLNVYGMPFLVTPAAIAVSWLVVWGLHKLKRWKHNRDRRSRSAQPLDASVSKRTGVAAVVLGVLPWIVEGGLRLANADPQSGWAITALAVSMAAGIAAIGAGAFLIRQGRVISAAKARGKPAEAGSVGRMD